MDWKTQLIDGFDWFWNSYYGILGFGVVLVAFALRKRIVKLLLYAMVKFARLPISLKESNRLEKVLWAFEWIFVVMVMNLYFIIRHPMFYAAYLTMWFRILYIALIAWGTVQTIQLLGKQRLANDSLTRLNQTVQSLLYRFVAALVGIIAIMMIIAELGYNMSGLLAGVGLGGLAIALAAQDMVANLFGCFLIVFDKPFELGDWIQTPDLEGIVEDISFRTCRLRTFDNALLSVPNSKLTNDLVINWSKMKHRKLLVYIGVTYDTSRDKMERCIERIRKMLISDQRIVKESVHVYFHSLNSLNMDFRVQCNVINEGFGPFLQVRESIHYAIVDIVREEGITFASMPLMHNDWMPKS